MNTDEFQKLMDKLNTCLDCIKESPALKESKSDTSFRKISENSGGKFSPLITSPLPTKKKVTVHERIQESIFYLEEDRQTYLEVGLLRFNDFAESLILGKPESGSRGGD